MQRLWDEAAAVDPARLPDWFDAETAKKYRWLGMVDVSAIVEADRAAALAELRELERCGLIVDPPPETAALHNIYMQQLQRSQVWSIGIFVGLSPFSISPLRTTSNPVLTRDDVTDVPAAFVADPFLVRTADKWHMFFEVLNWRTGKGEIGWATSNDGAKWHYEKIILAEPFHLSYPYTFFWKGDYYMVPESHEAQSVRLYRAKHFPAEWEFVATLLDGGMFQDPSIVRFQDHWYLFAETSPEIKNDTLRLYLADGLHGPWREHPKSPLRVNDPRLSRPAGRVVAYGDKLIRFAQDCTTDYGRAVHAISVTKLTPTDYEECELSNNPLLSAGPEAWRAEGMHHLDARPRSDGSWLAAVDGWHWGNCGW